MKVLLFTCYYLPGYKGGGPIKTITNLVNTTYDTIEYKIVSSDRDLGDFSPYSEVSIGSWNKNKKSVVFYISNGYIGIKQIFNIIFKEDYDVIYLNSFFSVRFSFIPLLLAKIMGKPIILSPRGELSEGALSLKSFKKKFYIMFYKTFRLNNFIFQASSQYEANDINKIFGSKTVTFIAENIGSQQYTNKLINKEKDIIKIVFLSRISPMKNLAYALDVLLEVKCSVVFDIYGPIEDKNYWEQCNEIIKKLPKFVHVNYRGAITPNKVVTTLSNYDLFFLPTRGENYGHVIAEAICAGLPILISDNTPWRNLQAEKIGWDIPLDQKASFIHAIEEASSVPASVYKEYRNNVLSWAKHKFDQHNTIARNIAMFHSAVKKNR